VWWCEGIVEAMPPFIGARVAVGAAARATRARPLRWARGLGDDGVVFTTSRRGYERERRGKGTRRVVGTVHVLARQWRARSSSPAAVVAKA
jgi:hypothetical protein